MIRFLTRLLFVVEAAAVIVAAVFGILWARNPTGPYEPITFLALLLGGTVVEIIRRRIPAQHANGSEVADRSVPEPPVKPDLPTNTVVTPHPQVGSGSPVMKSTPIAGSVGSSNLQVHEAALDLGSFASREVRVVYPEPFIERPHLHIRVQSSFGNKVVIEAEDERGFTVVKPGFWVSGGGTDVVHWQATGQSRFVPGPTERRAGEGR